MLFVIKCRYWSCRAGNEAEELDLTPDRIDAKALASFGTKDLLDPARTRKVFQQIEKKAQHPEIPDACYPLEMDLSYPPRDQEP